MDSKTAVCLCALASLVLAISLGPRTTVASEAVLSVVIPPERVGDTRFDYYRGLLVLALDKTQDAYGTYRIEQLRAAMTQGRAIKELISGASRLNVIWSGTSIERESRLRPVRVPLSMGMLGHRIFIIRRDLGAAFASVETLADLRRFKACQGEHWPDTTILRAAALPVVTSTSYDHLFRLVNGGRCDYFPRGLHEPFGELWVRRSQYPDLIVEPRILLHYPLATYFFTNREDDGLAQRIEQGLRQAVQDGSLERYMAEHPATAGVVERAGAAGRQVLRIDNPLLPPETPLDDATLWLRIGTRTD